MYKLMKVHVNIGNDDNVINKDSHNAIHFSLYPVSEYHKCYL